MVVVKVETIANKTQVFSIKKSRIKRDKEYHKDR